MIQLGVCLYCDKPLIQSLRGRNRKFCSEKCRDAYKPYRQDEEDVDELE